jgi:hypothetical protein
VSSNRVKVVFLNGETTIGYQTYAGVVWNCKCGNQLSYIHGKNIDQNVTCERCGAKYKVKLDATGTIVAYIQEYI